MKPLLKTTICALAIATVYAGCNECFNEKKLNVDTTYGESRIVFTSQHSLLPFIYRQRERTIDQGAEQDALYIGTLFHSELIRDTNAAGKADTLLIQDSPVFGMKKNLYLSRENDYNKFKAEFNNADKELAASNKWFLPELEKALKH